MRIVAVVLLAAVATACTASPGVTLEPPATTAPAASERPTDRPSPTPSRTLESPGNGGSPGPTAIDLLPLLASQVTVLNLEDKPLTLTVTLLDTESTDEFEVGSFDLQPLQVTTQSVIPARLRLEFRFANSSAAVQSCTIDVVEGEELQFAVVATGIAMTTSGEEPPDPADMVVATAARCHAGGST